MNSTVFDIETDGIQATKIHCVSYKEGQEIVTLTDLSDIREFFLKSKCLCGHNIITYDIPTVERLLDIEVGAKLIDTLALSWYTDPERPRHGLESYGEEFNIPKPKVEDWENEDLEVYINRCERDVAINDLLWKRQWGFLKRLYKDEAAASRLIAYLTFKMDCAAEQELHGWKLDIDRCKEGLAGIEKDEAEKKAELASIMPKVPKYALRKKPKKMFKQDGTLSALGERWLSDLRAEGLPEDTKDFIQVQKYEDPNPGSVPQIKEFLFSLGWKPDEFKFVRDKKTGDTRKIPQISKQMPGEVGVCDSVKLLMKKNPKLNVLEGLSILTHRKSLLKGFLADVDEKGFVRAQIQGFTNTLRFKHKVVLNLPKPSVSYGELIRGCLIAPEGYELCGSDVSSLEDRVKQHYLYKYDPEYVDKMRQDDYDPHLDLAEYSGRVTPEQVSQYKKGVAEVKKVLSGIRGTYKATNYAAQYGAGPFRISLTAGVPMHEAEKLHRDYWKKNWAIKAVADDCEVKQCGGHKWLYNPVSKFWYWLKTDKDRFSTLCQGTGVYCFDTWLRHIRENGPPVIGQFHDEIVAVLSKGRREKMVGHLRQAMKKANEELNLNSKLDVDVQFGNNYAEIH